MQLFLILTNNSTDQVPKVLNNNYNLIYTLAILYVCYIYWIS